MQEIYDDISDLLKLDYPPRIEIAIQSVPTSPESGALCLHVDGLNEESIFVLLPSMTRPCMPVWTCIIQIFIWFTGDVTKQVTLETTRMKVTLF